MPNKVVISGTTHEMILITRNRLVEWLHNRFPGAEYPPIETVKLATLDEFKSSPGDYDILVATTDAEIKEGGRLPLTYDLWVDGTGDTVDLDSVIPPNGYLYTMVTNLQTRKPVAPASKRRRVCPSTCQSQGTLVAVRGALAKVLENLDRVIYEDAHPESEDTEQKTAESSDDVSTARSAVM